MPVSHLKTPAMRDVARLAGVAPMTVSRALGGHPSVRPETRQQVQLAARKLGYVHNFVARALLRRGSRLIALVVPNVSNSVFAETIHGLEEILQAEGYTLIIGHSGYSKEAEEKLVRTLLGYGPDAVVLTGFTHTKATRTLLRRARIPVVETWNIGAKPLDVAVGFSNFEAAKAITRLMIDRGCRRLAYASGTQTDNDRTQAREAGFRRALNEAGLAVRDALVSTHAMELESGMALARDFARMRRMPDGLFAASDIIASGFILESCRLGIKIPYDIAVAGFDDAPLSNAVEPRLTTVHVPQREIGRATAQILLRRLAGEKNVPTQRDVGFKIIERASTRLED